MAETPETGKRVGTRERGTNTRVGGGHSKPRKVATGPDPNTGITREYASAGRYSSLNTKGEIVDDTAYRNKMRNIRGAANALVFGGESKTAALFGEGMLGGADIVDSQNIGYYSYEFPVDALELPQSRAEELRFYRLAYDRDPIVSRAINMHTELPLSKVTLDKPKCSSEEYKDYIYDFYQGLCREKKLFSVLIDGAREYWMMGEAFYYIEEKEKVEPCPAAKKQLEEGDPGENSETGSEAAFNPPMGGTADQIMDWIEPTRKASLIAKAANTLNTLKTAGIKFDPEESLDSVISLIKAKKAELLKKQRKVAKVVGRVNHADEYPIQVTAAPGDPVPGAAPAVDPAAPGGAPGEPGADPGADPAAGGEGAPLGPEGMADVTVPEGGAAGAVPMGGGGGGGMPVTPADLGGAAKDAVALGVSMQTQRELMQMRHYIKLLERKKQLLEKLKELREKRKEELELFSHITNPKYRGFFRIQILPPEQMEMSNEGTLTDGPTIYYKPPEAQKEQYLQAENVPNEVKDKIQQEGKIPLNQDPFKGSYVVHFARKKANYELHGRSIIQPVIRSCIYREKLRQVQSTIASRNMTPKTMVVAPGVPMSEVFALRALIDEAKADPDFTIVVNYEAQWNEIGSEARLLALDGEYQHTNSDLAIGLGLSPEILIGEGLYSGNRIQLEILNTAYLQFRDLITDLVEEMIFKPIAMKKGFYETDKWGRPRWIYPKISFSRMALRDSGDLYDMLFNLYAKGSLPVEIIYEFLNIDPEDCKRKLEDSLFTVNDSKFNELLSSLYQSMSELILSKSDLLKRVIEGLQLNEVDNNDEGPEGTGEGM
jgi:hypothetical protein